MNIPAVFNNLLFLKHKFNRKTNRGLTLIEIMVVITIISILAIAIITYTYNARARGEVQQCQTELFRLSQAMEGFKMNNAYYYATGGPQSVKIIRTKVGNDKWLPDSRCPSDPSASGSYMINSDGAHYTIYCSGDKNRHKGRAAAGMPQYRSLDGKIVGVN